jgi:colicin import membrane protein
MQETVPIETVSDSEFNKVMQGDKSAKDVLKDATTKVDKVDPTPDPTPTPPTAQADKTVPTPPPPPVQQPVTPPMPPTPPPPPVAEAKPTPPVPTPPTPPPPLTRSLPPVPTPPERVDPDAEPIAPKPVPTPPQPPERTTEAKPVVPPVKPHPVPKPPKAPPKPDQLAKLLEQTPDAPADKPKPKPVKPAKPAPTPPPQQTDEQSQSHTFDLTDISRLLSHDEPAQKAATGRAPSKVASLGSPTARDDKMAPSLWGQLDGLMEEQYRQCWSYLGLNAGQKYVPQIRVTYDENGGLASEPVLVNPPSDPALRNLAESAMRAVRRCNPLRIPAQYAPYYDEWKGRVLRFDPQEMAG